MSTFTISSQPSGHKGNRTECRKRPLFPAVTLQRGLLDSPAGLVMGHSYRGQSGVRPRWASLEWAVGSLLTKCTV